MPRVRGVLLEGSELAVVASLARAGLNAASRGDRIDARSPGALAARRLVDLLEAEAVAAGALVSIDVDVDEAPDPMSAAAAAERLDLDARQVRRLAPALGGRKVGGEWVLSAALVEAERARRAALIACPIGGHSDVRVPTRRARSHA